MNIRFDRHRLLRAALTGLLVGAAMAGCALTLDLDPRIPDAPLIIGTFAGVGTAILLIFIA
jgi:hypothetical protein